MINLLKLIPGLAGIIPSPITIYIMLGIAAASAAGGGWVVYKFWQASEVTAVNEARATERDAVLIGNEHERGVLDRARQRSITHESELEELRLRLAHGTYCNVPVPRAWVRRDVVVSRAAADPGGARPAAPRVDTNPPNPPLAKGGDAEQRGDSGPVADAGDVVLTCERNRVEVYEPEADERAALRAWYNGVRARFNR